MYTEVESKIYGYIECIMQTLFSMTHDKLENVHYKVTKYDATFNRRRTL